MKFRLSLLVTCALVALACGPQPEAPVQAANEGPALKSLHLVNVPSDVSEAELASAFADVNRVIADMGYSGAGYRLWKKSGEGDGEYSHVWEGSWPSQAVYDEIHDAEAHENAIEPLMPVFEKLNEHQTYQRYAEVTATP